MENKREDKIYLNNFLSFIGITILITFALFAMIFRMGQMDQDRIGPDYKVKQAQQFDQKTLIKMSNDFIDPSVDAQRYSKNKSNDFKRMLLTHALKRNDLNTLMQIYKKDPTKINKIYVLACAWNNRYDNNNLTKYGKSLNYYTQHLTKQDKKLISPFLQHVIDSCDDDPTGVMQKWDIFGIYSDTAVER